jgi:hypothetical protein
MFKPIPILLLLLSCILPASGQVKVVDASEISGKYSSRYLPDVEGKVLVATGYSDYSVAGSVMDTVTVFPGWPLSRTGTNERGGVYANLDDDPELELVYPAGPALYAFNIDGSDVPGWPQTLDFPTDGAPAFGDIDGDGAGEIVVTTHQTGTFAFGTIYAFERDGTNVAGFPVATEQGGAVRTPVLADLDWDNALEIIVAVRNWPEGLIYVFRGDGTLFPNWPVKMDYIPGSAVAVGDINGDNIPEIVAESYYSLHAFRTDGIILDGFPYYPGLNRVFSYSAPVLADLDGDGNREIICGDHSIDDGTGAVHIVNYDGTPWAGWPKITSSWVYGPPSIGDINNDGLLDIAVGDEALSITPINKVYAWTAQTGDPLPGFPIRDVFGVNNQIILADIDGDNMIDLLFDDNTSEGKYIGYKYDGTVMEGWPLLLDGSTFFINPFVVDINLDGMMDISGAGTILEQDNINIYLWNANVAFNSDLAVLPVLQYNTRHTGVYGDTFMVGEPDIPAEINGGWNIYPNPATTNITLKPPQIKGISNPKEDLLVEIYQPSGKMVQCKNFGLYDNQIRFNLTGYPSGIYWVEIRSESKAEEVIKFIIISR